MLKAIIAGLGVSLVVVLGGCATGNGGGMDVVTAKFDPSANARVQLRGAAVEKFEPTQRLAAAHNQEQQTLAPEQRREIMPWWLDENRGVSIKAIEGHAISSIVSKYKDLAANRPAPGTDAEALWLEMMEGYVTLFKAQADALEAIADHYEVNGTSAAMSPEQLATAVSQIRERAVSIRSYEVNFTSGAVTARLEPGNARTTVPAQSSGNSAPAVTERDVKNGTKALDAYNRGNPVDAAQRAGKVVFGSN
jgi:hypothetical protein